MATTLPKPQSYARAHDTNAPRILVIYTGGTIGMTESNLNTLKPFDFSHLMENVPKLARLGYDISHVEFNPAIDSSNMNPTYWALIARYVAQNYDDFDGFVVLHGTDTMAYTASALSFMLGNLRKPVVLTGSQLPIGEIREDGTENLITALQIAAARTPSGDPQLQEVAISFGRYLLRGNRSVKTSSTNFGAFRSPNYPPLAQMDLHIEFNHDYLWRTSADGPLDLFFNMDSSVCSLFLYPGISQEHVSAVLEEPGVKGIVLRTFGAGNAPTQPWFLDAVKKACAQGKVLVNITQCLAGGVEQKRYATGDALAQAGVVSGFDMTGEAALTKLMHLFGRGLSAAEVSSYMTHSLCGEVSKR